MGLDVPLIWSNIIPEGSEKAIAGHKNVELVDLEAGRVAANHMTRQQLKLQCANGLSFVIYAFGAFLMLGAFWCIGHQDSSGHSTEQNATGMSNSTGAESHQSDTNCDALLISAFVLFALGVTLTVVLNNFVPRWFRQRNAATRHGDTLTSSNAKMLADLGKYNSQNKRLNRDIAKWNSQALQSIESPTDDVQSTILYETKALLFQTLGRASVSKRKISKLDAWYPHAANINLRP